MRIAVVAPRPIPPVVGGTERAVEGLRTALADAGHDAELVTVGVDERDLPGVLDGYAAAWDLDLSRFDRIVSVKYPVWAVRHPHHVVLVFHPLRGLYDGYAAFGLAPEEAAGDPEVERAVAALGPEASDADARAALDQVRDRLGALPADHPDLRFPGPVARRLVHALDARALRPGRVERHLALSRTVATRPGYFPAGVTPRVVRLPGAVPMQPADAVPRPRRGLFTVSRLDGGKRLDLLVDAMVHVPGDATLAIAGVGPHEAALRARAAHDPRITFLGAIDDDDLQARLASAVAVPFVPHDEDLGLVTLEAFGQATPVVTTTDSGGPTELVVDGVTGRVVAPTPGALGRALTEVLDDPRQAEAWGQAARRRAETVSWDAVVDAVVGTDLGPVRPGSARSGAAQTGPAASAGARRRAIVLTTFPLDAAVSGGARRARHLYGGLTERFDVHVVAIGSPSDLPGERVLPPGLRQHTVLRSPAHAAVGEEASARVQVPVTDIVAGTHLGLTPAYIDTVRDLVRAGDVVILAEPYLQPALDAIDVEVAVVYDAYNVEVDLKDRILPAGAAGDALRASVRTLERGAVDRATTIVACSAEVGRGLVAVHGPVEAPVVVVANGADVPPEAALAARRSDATSPTTRRLRQAGRDGRERDAVALFVGSWHPPNLEAAEVLVELATARPDVQILSVGHHGVAFADRVVPPNLTFTGRVGEAAHRVLLGHVDIALNPMRSGSGTNLKLVEDLAWEIPTVSTPFGARGLPVVDGVHLLLAEVESLPDAVTSLLADPEAARARARAGRRLVVEQLGWPALVASMLDAVEGAAGRA